MVSIIERLFQTLYNYFFQKPKEALGMYKVWKVYENERGKHFEKC
jgi:hypothetical protein